MQKESNEEEGREEEKQKYTALVTTWAKRPFWVINDKCIILNKKF